MATNNNKSGSRLVTKNICQERQIKVSRALYEYQPKTDDDHPTYYRTQYVPWIQMKGHWLRQAGFEIDTPIKVRVMNRCLVLTTKES